MATVAAHHQFEIRYTPILNFPNVILDPMAPFVKLTKRINVENDGSHNEKITLIFDNEFYQITVMWDRIVFRYEGDIETLTINNSIVDEPFFNIFNKIQHLDNFGEINNILYYSFVIHRMDISKEVLLDKFASKYLNNLKKIMDDPTDYAIVLDHIVGVKQNNLTFGPFFGDEDLKKRNLIDVKNPIVIDNTFGVGLCCEFKYIDHLKSVNFSDYKSIAKIENSYIQRIWEL